MRTNAWTLRISYSAAITCAILITKKALTGQIDTLDFGVIFVTSIAFVFFVTAILKQRSVRSSEN